MKNYVNRRRYKTNVTINLDISNISDIEEILYLFLCNPKI